MTVYYWYLLYKLLSVFWVLITSYADIIFIDISQTINSNLFHCVDRVILSIVNDELN